MDPFTDVITKVLWRYLKKDEGGKDDQIKNLDDKEILAPDITDREESQIAEVYENIKYFEKQRNKNACNESISGEKLSFKGKLASSKCDDSVINLNNENSNLHKENEGIACNRSNIDNKSFSFKNISNMNKNKNEDNDTINDMLYSQNSSKKSLIKGFEDNPPANNFSNLGFFNVKSILEPNKIPNESCLKKVGEGSQFNLKNNDSIKDKSMVDNRGISSFGRSLKFKPMESPMKSTFFYNNENNSRYMKQYGEEGANCSMLGVIDDNSNNIDNGYMFINEKHSMNIDQTNVIKQYLTTEPFNIDARAGLQSKLENPSNNIFDNNIEHSNISQFFQNNNESNTLFNNLFCKDNQAEKSELKPESPRKENDTMRLRSNINLQFNSINKPINTPVEENIPKQYPPFTGIGKIYKKQANKQIQKISEDIKLDWDKHNKDECSLPHPMDLFRLKELNLPMSYQSSMIKTRCKSIYKTLKQKKHKRSKRKNKKRMNAENQHEMAYGRMYPFGYPDNNSIIGEPNFGYNPLDHMNPIISQNNTPAINPYFHCLVEKVKQRKEKKSSQH